ncbi:MAG: NTPase [Deltaproteobacteria bacterium]|nr:NTPase [Deltaproteobacteria bacterium]
MKAKNILITGPPGCGKSTLMEKIVRQIDRPVTGFFTREWREKGRRVGFSIVTLAGQAGTLSHESHRGPRVGRYGVHLDDLEKIAVPSMIPTHQGEIVIIDEIGKMECLSPLFQETLVRVLDSEHPVIGSIALKGDAFMEKIKRRRDVRLVAVSAKNRDRLLFSLLEEIREMISGVR